MKKKLIAIFIALILMSVLVLQVVPAFAQAGVLDRVQITPASVTLASGGTQQFTAQAYDSENAAIPDLTYYWTVVAGGGGITPAGLFTAGTTPGTYTNTVEVIAVQGTIVRFALASVTVSVTAGPLDHVNVTPATATVAVGGNQQFTAQGFDAANVAITGLSYSWGVLAGGGTITSAGLFTAGSVVGTYTGTVQAIAVQGSIIKAGVASVTVTATTPTPTPTPTPIPGLNNRKLASLVKGFLANIGFGNSISGQWVVKDPSGTLTIKAIPGVVKAVTDTSLTLLPNGETENRVFALTADTVVMPEDTQLKIDDKVVVVTVNDQVRLVIKSVAPTTIGARLPPGLSKKSDLPVKKIPPGWSKGKKTGWEKNEQEDSDEENDSDEEDD